MTTDYARKFHVHKKAHCVVLLSIFTILLLWSNEELCQRLRLLAAKPVEKSNSVGQRPLVVCCRVLRPIEDVDANRCCQNDGDRVMTYDELDIMETCYGVRPVLMSHHSVEQNISNSGLTRFTCL